MNSLDPRAKRLRVAERSLQQARHALQGVLLALQDLPRSRASALTEALDTTQVALETLSTIAQKIEEVRWEASTDDL